MNDLEAFLQSASNTAANTVADPVDMIGNGLRWSGVPIPTDPVGGREWMRQQGLIRDVPPGMAKALGTSMGIITPALAAGYARDVPIEALVQMLRNK